MEKDIGYSENFLSSFNQMRMEQFICDFTVKISNESFPVHRAVLAAASKYFTAMFSSNMKEVREGFVVMKDLEVEGVRQCIEYMYTGCVKPSNDSVEYTLKASHLIQLDGLTSICFKFLQNNLSVDTCISTFNISSFHDRDDVSTLSRTFVIEHFEAVTLTEMFPFISKSDLVYYIEASEAEYQVAWQAVMRWFSVARGKTSTELLDVMKSINLIQKVFIKLFKLLKFEFFSRDFLRETVWTETLVNESQKCKDILLGHVRQKCKTEQTLVPHIACLHVSNGDIKALNLETKQWMDLPSVDIAEISVSVTGILNIRDKMYCLVHKNMFELNLNQMKWIPKQPLVRKPRDIFEMVSFQQSFYVLDLKFMSYYTPAEDAWVENLNGCGLVNSFCAASSDKFIYAMGGWIDGKSIADAKRFNPDTQSWSTITSMNTGRNAASAAVFREMVFVVGGKSNSVIIKSVEVYNPITKVWTDIKSMRVTRKFPYACAANNRLYVVGGACGKKGKFLDPGSIEVYDKDTDEWEIVVENKFVQGYTPCCGISLEDAVK